MGFRKYNFLLTNPFISAILYVRRITMERVNATSLACVLEAISKHEDLVIMSAAEYNGIQETLYLKSIPNMEQSIIASACAPRSEFVKFAWKN